MVQRGFQVGPPEFLSNYIFQVPVYVRPSKFQILVLACLFPSMHMRMGFIGGPVGNESACNAGDRRRGFRPWVRKIPWRRARQPTAVFLPGEANGPRSLVDYRP